MKGNLPMHLSSRVLLATACLLIATGCGSSDPAPKSEEGTGSGSDTSAPAPTPAPAEPKAPSYRILGKPALTKALLGVQDMPPGYSQDPPSAASPNKTFCNYKTPFDEKVYVSRDFTKGGGLSAELLRVGLRQYANAQQAKAAFTALTDALETCTGETYEGTKLTYAPMSAAKVGDGSVGVKITADDTVLLQNFALIGPTLVSTGGGGLMNANADEVTNLLQDQAKAYQNAATQ